jgi:hypothetical protein
MEKMKLKPGEKSSSMIAPRSWEEVIGKFEGTSIEDESVILTLKVRGKRIYIRLPEAFDDPVLARIAVGDKIGILKVDLPSRPFILRRL